MDAEWKGPNDRLVVSTFVMTPAEQHAVARWTKDYPNYKVVISRLEPEPDHPEWPSLIVRLYGKDDKQGWGYRIWPSGSVRTLSGSKPRRKGA